MTNLQVQRNELKYFINNIEYHSLINRLKNALEIDKYSVPRKGYFIRSLYFDSFDDECLYEKLAGVETRKKYRLRTYDLHAESVKFEIKHKLINQIYKETATISRDSASAIIGGNYEEMLKYGNPILNKIYAAFKKGFYKPKVVVEYERDAFIFKHFQLRITIDKNLRSGSTFFNLFSDDFKSLPFSFDGCQILEIKYNLFFPEFIKNLVQLDSMERAAISKYVLARRYFKTHTWEDI